MAIQGAQPLRIQVGSVEVVVPPGEALYRILAVLVSIRAELACHATGRVVIHYAAEGVTVEQHHASSTRRAFPLS